MTPQQALQYAQHVPPLDPHSEREMLRSILTELLTKPAVQRAAQGVLFGCLQQAEHFQRASVPGHETWYPRHIQRAALLAKMLDLSTTD